MPPLPDLEGLSDAQKLDLLKQLLPQIKRLTRSAERKAQEDGAYGRIVRIWRRWVYDGHSGAPEWKTHPHRRFKPIGRFFFACLGSIIPMGVLLIATNLTEKWDERHASLAFDFTVTVVTLLAVWLVSALWLAATVQTRLIDYAVAGLRTPTVIALVIHVIQVILKE